MKTLIIVESPAKASKIVKCLGKNFMSLATYGHCFDLKSGQLGIDINNKFKPKYEIIADKKEKLRAIIKTDSSNDENNILLGTDTE